MSPIEELQAREPYDVIYADPPWRYDFSPTAAKAIERHYPTMALQDICELRPPAAKNAALVLWTTAPKLQESFEVISAWGFRYKTNLVWDKEKLGLGHYARGQHEHLLIATRGSMRAPAVDARPRSVVRQARGRHSEKPWVFYEIVERWWPEARRLEMFARNEDLLFTRSGWEFWGNQAAVA